MKFEITALGTELENRGLNPHKFSRFCKVTPAQITRWTNGDHKPTDKSIDYIQGALDMFDSMVKEVNKMLND